ncbi:hypothetical protein JXA02_12750 [candidate division KSB1 bacterium]|nr:hypothetical protein [candidate division KSB1 bacterium]
MILMIWPVLSSTGRTTDLLLNEEIGDVIDARENDRYNFFGAIPGFAAAQLMPRGSDAFSFYLLRNSADRAQFTLLDMHEQSLVQIRSKIAGRIAAVEQDTSSIEEAVFPVAESLWHEKSGHKKVVLRDGSQFYGIFARARTDTLIVQTQGGLIIAAPMRMIVNIFDDVPRGEGKFYRSDPHATRLLFAPTGRGLSAGRGYFADYYIFFPTLAYGVTDFLTIAGGMSIIPGLPLPQQIFYFMPKMTFRASDKVGIAGGLLFLPIPEEQEDLSLAYSVASFGSEEGALTLGLGVPIISGTSYSPVILIGGDLQVSNSVKLITENWLFTGPDTFALLSGGIRFFSDRIAVDLAIITSDQFWQGEGFPFLPWVDFAVLFGK